MAQSKNFIVLRKKQGQVQKEMATDTHVDPRSKNKMDATKDHTNDVYNKSPKQKR